MKALLLTLVLKLIGLQLPADHIFRVRADVAATAMENEIATAYGEMSLIDQEKRARIAMVWGLHESGLQANPSGSNDKGGACGFGQVHPQAFPAGTFPSDLTCSAMRSNVTLGIRGQLVALRHFETKCGSLSGALTAYSTNGLCPKSGQTIGLVLRRCLEAGVPGCL